MVEKHNETRNGYNELLFESRGMRSVLALIVENFNKKVADFNACIAGD